jgi:hypothetical protein
MESSVADRLYRKDGVQPETKRHDGSAVIVGAVYGPEPSSSAVTEAVLRLQGFQCFPEVIAMDLDLGLDLVD